MAWFYNGKQIYGAWTDGYGVEHPADWETAWSDAEKKKVGLISRGTLNDRFFDEDGEKHSVDYIQAHEEVRMQGLLAMILGQTMSDTISDSDGETTSSDSLCAQPVAKIQAQQRVEIAFKFGRGS